MAQVEGFEPPIKSLESSCIIRYATPVNGAGRETRTLDNQVGNLLLYQLSYTRKYDSDGRKYLALRYELPLPTHW